MRRKDREQEREFGEQVLDKCTFATLSMIDDNSNPYGIPISIVRAENVLYFHCAMQGKKIDILKKRSQICISAVGDTRAPLDQFTMEYESALVFGPAKEVIDDEEKIFALRLLCERFTPNNMHEFDEAILKSLKRTAVWKIHIESLTAKCKKIISR